MKTFTLTFVLLAGFAVAALGAPEQMNSQKFHVVDVNGEDFNMEDGQNETDMPDKNEVVEIDNNKKGGNFFMKNFGLFNKRMFNKNQQQQPPIIIVVDGNNPTTSLPTTDTTTTVSEPTTSDINTPTNPSPITDPELPSGIVQRQAGKRRIVKRRNHCRRPHKGNNKNKNNRKNKNHNKNNKRRRVVAA